MTDSPRIISIDITYLVRQALDAERAAAGSADEDAAAPASVPVQAWTKPRAQASAETGTGTETTAGTTRRFSAAQIAS